MEVTKLYQPAEFKQLIQDASKLAKEKGFWDKERNLYEVVMLIVSECGEALEAHRKGKRADMSDWGAQYNGCDMLDTNERMGFETWIKDSFEDELADVIIRIADLCGGLGIEPKFLEAQNDIEDNVGENLLAITMMLCASIDFERVKVPKYRIDTEPLGLAVSMIYDLARKMNIDLDRHIKLKMQYNQGRERMHGKAY